MVSSRVKAYRGVCRCCGGDILEVVLPSGAVMVCDAGKKRHVVVGGTWDSCCIWGYAIHDCPSAPGGVPVGAFNLEETPVDRL